MGNFYLLSLATQRNAWVTFFHTRWLHIRQEGAPPPRTSEVQGGGYGGGVRGGGRGGTGGRGGGYGGEVRGGFDLI